MPVVVTLCLLNGDDTFVVDASKEEEAIATGLISVAINQHRELCGIKKYGGAPVSSETLRHALQVRRLLFHLLPPTLHCRWPRRTRPVLLNN